jgi:hypothetical protein
MSSIEKLMKMLTAEEKAIVTDKAKAAKDLALKHFKIEPGMTQIFTIWEEPQYEALPSTPIKLLEVNQNTVTSGIQPLGFDAVPSAGIRYPSVILEVTPDEFLRIRSQQLSLPPGWTIGEAVVRPSRGRRQ